MSQRVVRNLVLRQLQEEDNEDARDDIVGDQDFFDETELEVGSLEFFGDGEVEQISASNEEDEVSHSQQIEQRL